MGVLNKKPSKISAYLIVFGIIEVPASLGSFTVMGHGFEDGLGWFSAINAGIASVIVASLLGKKISRRPSRTGVRSTKKMQGWRSQVGATVLGILLIAAIVVWRLVVYGWIIDTSLQDFGVVTTATITNYQLFSGEGKHELPTDSLSQATKMNLVISYNGHSSTILIDQTDPNYQLLYNKAYGSDRKLMVRYLRPLPTIVHITDVND